MEGHRVPAQSGNGRLVRQQAANLCDLAVKYSLTQQVTEPTREKEILDLIWSSNPDLVSNIQVDSFKDFTDHSVVSATTSYRLGREVKKEENYLLDSGKRFKLLDFSKAPWPEIKYKLNQVNWESLETLAEQDVTAAHALFIDTILPVLEELVPQKPVGKRFGHSKVHRKRRCLWRKLGRIKKQLLKSSSVSKTAALLQKKRALELELKRSYDRQVWEQESKVVNEMKTNTKAFYAYGRARQVTKAKVGPFLDPITGTPNPDPDYTAKILSEQYSSVFTSPRPEYLVNHMEEFFSGGTDWRVQHEGKSLLEDIKFTKQDFVWACKELKCSSSPGPDGIPAALLKTAFRN